MYLRPLKKDKGVLKIFFLIYPQYFMRRTKMNVYVFFAIYINIIESQIIYTAI